MKTLFEKLKPETLKELVLEAIKYPSTVELLTEQLTKVSHIGQLTINDATRLLSLNKSFVKLDVDQLSDLFDE